MFKEEEKIKVNPKFASKMIKMNIIPVKTFKKKVVEVSAEEQAQRNQIRKERQFVIQAHVVKVMKAQKSYRF